MKRAYLSTRRMIFTYFNCVLHKYIKHIHNLIICCPILNCMIHYNVCKINAIIGQFCGLVEIIVGNWIW